MIGSQLSHYRITAKLGEGGMGEVYRAEDTNLGREVAVKILPPQVSTDPERLERFEREAKAVAALSHPNILAIHDFGTEGGTTFAIMELLEGHTLQELLAAGAIPQRKAIDYARQMANGLAAAHDKGVVHRDLKPANVFVTNDGRVKLLDFGLAKVVFAGASGDDPTLAATLPGETDPGTVLGTVGYMSPEQVRGVAADPRSDLFSLGVILYEMLTARRAFQRESAVETMSAILKDEPEEISRLVDQPLAGGLERLVQRCLEKQPDERFQSARDLAFSLEATSQMSTSGFAAAPAPLPARVRQLRLEWVGLALIIGLFVGGAISWLLWGLAESSFPTIQRLTYRRGMVWSARFGADGQSVIYGAAWEGQPVELFTTLPGSPGARSLDVGHADILSVSASGELAISLDRQFVSGWESQGTLAQVSATGGAPRQLLEGVQEAAWSPDGGSLAVIREAEGRVGLEYPIGRRLRQTGGWLSLLRIRPQNDLIAFVDHPVRGDNIGVVAVVDRQGQYRQLSARGAQGLAWRPDGKELWGSSGETIYGWTLAGEERIVYRGSSAGWLQEIGADGRVLLIQTALRREIVGRPPGATDEQTLSWFNWSSPAALTDDGDVVLFEEQNLGTAQGYALFTRTTAGSPAIQLGNASGLALSADGKWCLAMRNAFSASDRELVLLPTGAGQPRPLSLGDLIPLPLAKFLPDGSAFVIAVEQPGRADRLLRFDLETGTLHPLTDEGISLLYANLAVSPDGAQVVGLDPQGQARLYPVDGSPAVPLTHLGPGEVPVQWSEDGAWLYYYRPGRIPIEVGRVNLQTGERRTWAELRPADPAGVFNIDRLLIARDGRGYVYSYRRLLTELVLIEGLH